MSRVRVWGGGLLWNDVRVRLRYPLCYKMRVWGAEESTDGLDSLP